VIDVYLYVYGTDRCKPNSNVSYKGQVFVLDRYWCTKQFTES